MRGSLVLGILLLAINAQALKMEDGSMSPPPDGGTTASGLSADDQVKARAELQQLARAFGVQTVVETPDAGQPAAPEHKTMADVADRSLDMVKGLVASISSTLQTVAPHVWEVMIRQQYAKAIADLVLPIGLAFTAALYMIIIRRKWKEVSSRDADYWPRFWFAGVIPIVCLVICGICTAVQLSESIKYLINPEYYAVRDMITMLLAPQSM